MSGPAYDQFPCVDVPEAAHACVAGWDAIGRRLAEAVAHRPGRCTLVVECYPGSHEAVILRELGARLKPALAVHAAEALLPPGKIDALVAPFLGGNDPVFGVLSPLELPEFFDAAKTALVRARLGSQASGLTLVVGCGARHLATPDILVLADLARWEAQLRFRRQETTNLGSADLALSPGLKYKRAFFVDWRVADRWKRPLLGQATYFLDLHATNEPKLADGDAVRRGLQHAVTRPFRVVPFFDPAPWGGQWMKEQFGLDGSVPNYGWCFDCVPEENSLLLRFGHLRFELPSIDLVFDQPLALLGNDVYGRFGAEFPIRFDFLDTIGGGNLSFQVHPLTAYIREHFGMPYTQDESYYMLAAGPDATVYLGLRDGVKAADMAQALREARAGEKPFDADRFSNRLPAHQHDHFLIPAGTVHCSGRDSMVLEISATPYIFTFKLWDWGRLGLDGKPRPIYLEHGLANIQWDRTTTWVKKHLVNAIVPLGHGPGWREERTGLHELEFIETRRHWFTAAVAHDTRGTVNVLNLVEGDAAIVESPDHAFEPYLVHYAETFIVPAGVGPYTIRPARQVNRDFATLKAWCRPASNHSPIAPETAVSAKR